MDAFEQVVAEVLSSEGYWVKTSVKVQLTKEEKRLIARPSTPRWELDVVAYRPREDILQVIECKSFLNSRGVFFKDLQLDEPKSRYKLFVEPRTREVVFDRLKKQFIEAGACNESTTVKLGLACGKIASEADRSSLRELFKQNSWLLFDDSWLPSKLKKLANSDYENQVSAVVAKLFSKS